MHDVRKTLGDEAFALVHAHGRKLPLEDAVSHALDEQATTGTRSAEGEMDLATALTGRERQTAALIAQGLSNKEIAAALVIAQRTVEGHVENILRKLGFTSRTQVAAAWTAEHQPGTPA